MSIPFRQLSGVRTLPRVSRIFLTRTLRALSTVRPRKYGLIQETILALSYPPVFQAPEKDVRCTCSADAVEWPLRDRTTAVDLTEDVRLYQWNEGTRLLLEMGCNLGDMRDQQWQMTGKSEYVPRDRYAAVKCC